VKPAFVLPIIAAGCMVSALGQEADPTQKLDVAGILGATSAAELARSHPLDGFARLVFSERDRKQQEDWLVITIRWRYAEDPDLLNRRGIFEVPDRVQEAWVRIKGRFDGKNMNSEVTLDMKGFSDFVNEVAIAEVFGLPSDGRDLIRGISFESIFSGYVTQFLLHIPGQQDIVVKRRTGSSTPATTAFRAFVRAASGLFPPEVSERWALESHQTPNKTPADSSPSN